MVRIHSQSSEKIEFIETPSVDYPCIKNAPLPADGAGSDSFSNLLLGFLLAIIPSYLAFGRGLYVTILFGTFTTIPILMVFWTVASSISPRKNEKVKYPGRPVEYYLNFHQDRDRLKYRGKNKIPMETFYEKYFNGEVDFRGGDALEALEYRHDWASFRFTMGLFRHFLAGFFPKLLLHTRSQDENLARDNYDRGDDFYACFLGPRMTYASGVIGDINIEETLEQLEDNKLAVICEKISLKPGDTMLDIGCGWGTLAKYASAHYGAHVTGVTLSCNQAAWGNNCLRDAGIEKSQSRILYMDYRDAPPASGGLKYRKITCVEMAEHVGVRNFGSFLSQVYNMLDDDGVFFLQIVGLRKAWQYEDLIWGLFMNKYIFPGADASAPLGFVVNKLEAAGFEIKGIDTIGVHYSATIWHWYRNWMAKRDKIEAKYGTKMFKIWEFFLSYSTIISRQGSATCWQLTLVKNLNSTHRVEGINSQYGLLHSRQAAIERFGNGIVPSANIPHVTAGGRPRKV
ncbi:putative cyclopropane-fatty-acyl-phospholipid synthase [Aspergillus pseudoustus]|uniref:sphingolipid C(9)-methyltransferase n=1 Tax=Aspergillus pseudoustus TaxID=1810923 RepID=A0ABR4J8N6_9EURO